MIDRLRLALLNAFYFRLPTGLSIRLGRRVSSLRRGLYEIAWKRKIERGDSQDVEDAMKESLLGSNQLLKRLLFDRVLAHGLSSEYKPSFDELFRESAKAQYFASKNWHSSSVEDYVGRCLRREKNVLRFNYAATFLLLLLFVAFIGCIFGGWAAHRSPITTYIGAGGTVGMLVLYFVSKPIDKVRSSTSRTAKVEAAVLHYGERSAECRKLKQRLARVDCLDQSLEQLQLALEEA